MPKIIIRSENHDLINRETRFGVYIIQSGKNKKFFRIGAAGVNDKGTFAGRLKFHSQKSGYRSWTEQNRPWQTVWTAEMLGSSFMSVRLVEHALFAHFATRYKFIEDSTFKARRGGTQDVIKHANETEKTLRAIAKLEPRFKDII